MSGSKTHLMALLCAMATIGVGGDEVKRPNEPNFNDIDLRAGNPRNERTHPTSPRQHKPKRKKR